MAPQSCPVVLKGPVLPAPALTRHLGWVVHDFGHAGPLQARAAAGEGLSRALRGTHTPTGKRRHGLSDLPKVVTGQVSVCKPKVSTPLLQRPGG